MYDGSYPRMPENEYTLCNEASSCQCFYYGEGACSTGDHRRKSTCRKIHNLRNNIQALEHNVDVMLILQDPLMEGDICKATAPAAFSYICARMRLVHELLNVARQQHRPSDRNWNELNSILQENFRLCFSYIHELPMRKWCHSFSTSLLDCGRIEDSLSFASYMLSRTRPGQGLRRHTITASVKGDDWMFFPRKFCTNKDKRFGDLFLVFVIYIGKLKQFMVHYQFSLIIRSFQKTDFGQHLNSLEGPLAILLEYLSPHNLFEITTWTSEEILDSCSKMYTDILQFTDIIEMRNPHLLTSMAENLRVCTVIGTSTRGHSIRHNHQGENKMKKTSTRTLTRTENKSYKIMPMSPTSKEYADSCVKRCEFSLRTMPDLDIWLKYCIETKNQNL